MCGLCRSQAGRGTVGNRLYGRRLWRRRPDNSGSTCVVVVHSHLTQDHDPLAALQLDRASNDQTLQQHHTQPPPPNPPNNNTACSPAANASTHTCTHIHTHLRLWPRDGNLYSYGGGQDLAVPAPALELHTRPHMHTQSTTTGVTPATQQQD